MAIPTRQENPDGLHQRYIVYKKSALLDEKDLIDAERAEYFVLRLDDFGSDPEHIMACRYAVNVYADAIEHHLPQLAKDIREKWPVVYPKKQDNGGNT